MRHQLCMTKEMYDKCYPECPYCGKPTMTQRGMWLHIKAKHPKIKHEYKKSRGW